MEDIQMIEKTVIVTGSNTGIGKETAKGLVRRGARVILACRDRQRAEAARQEIVDETGNDAVIVKILDLASLESIKTFADDFNANEERLDLLVNNAAVCAKERKETADGFELSFGVNHLGHFYLTNLLLDKLKASSPSRVVIVSSDGYKFGKVNFADLQGKRRYNSLRVYCRSKTANILFGVQLAKVLHGTGVTAYSLHPGAVETELTRDYPKNGVFVKFLKCMACCFRMPYMKPEEGALTTLYCSLEPSIADHSGRYYKDCKEASARSFATDPIIAQKLWDVSMELCGLVGDKD